MESTDELTESRIRSAVRDAQIEAGRSLLSTILWTLVALFAVLVGLQLLQMAAATAGVTAMGFVIGGLVVTGCSLYLLYLLHWK